MQGARIAVDAEPYGLVLGDEGGGAARQRGDHHRLRQQPAHRVGPAGGAAAGGSAGGGTAARDAVAAPTAHKNTPVTLHKSTGQGVESGTVAEWG
ncbi:hypothetical protein GCM10009680_14850 [Streptomyces yatensis]|uniref:Uncharacterized protein n=1 Tax=Streptomyces yatensis TaxID=155177 RepID=A0ABN2GSY9_9ACTN